jgi:hypothetical protein
MDKQRAVYRIGLELVKTMGETYREVYSRRVGKDKGSEEPVKIPRCMFCGGVGIDLGKVRGRDIAACPDCARKLLPLLRELVKAAGRPRRSK